MTRVLFFLTILSSLGSYASAAPLYLNVGQSASIDQNTVYQYGGQVEVYCGGNYQPPPPPPPPIQHLWECTYDCGSKAGQEPKVGRGYSQQQAMRDAQAQTCTQYVGGQPQYFQGCSLVQQ